jgi:hypothetical protein
MKKILFVLAIIATNFSTADAQSKKSAKSSNKKGTKVSAEAKLKADIARIKEEKKLKTDSFRIIQMQSDSIRLADELLVEETKAAERAAWKQEMMRQTQSSFQTKWAAEAVNKDEWYASNRSQDAMIKAAKLNDTQGRQVKAINQTYLELAKAIKADVGLTDDDKKIQFTALNTERRERIKAVVGSNNEKKLEKQRVKITASDVDAAAFKWIDEAMPLVTAKKDNN